LRHEHPELVEAIASVGAALVEIYKTQGEVMAAIDDLVAAVTANTAATDAAVAAFATVTDDADIEAQVALVSANTAALVAATPVAPVVSDAPVDEPVVYAPTEEAPAE
jgi:hypothetical protein